MFAEMMDISNIVLLQETHGHEQCFEASAERHLKKFEVFANEGESLRAGGGAILIERQKFEGYEWQNLNFVKGRVQRAEGCKTIPRTGEATNGSEDEAGAVRMRRVIVWNVHNYGIDAEQMRPIREQMQKDLDLAKNNDQVIVWLGGDWNFCEDDEDHFAPDEAVQNFHGQAGEGGPNVVAWKTFTKQMTDVAGKELTHKNSSRKIFHASTGSTPLCRAGRWFRWRQRRGHLKTPCPWTRPTCTAITFQPGRS